MSVPPPITFPCSNQECIHGLDPAFVPGPPNIPLRSTTLATLKQLCAVTLLKAEVEEGEDNPYPEIPAHWKLDLLKRLLDSKTMRMACMFCPLLRASLASACDVLSGWKLQMDYDRYFTYLHCGPEEDTTSSRLKNKFYQVVDVDELILSDEFSNHEIVIHRKVTISQIWQKDQHCYVHGCVPAHFQWKNFHSCGKRIFNITGEPTIILKNQ